MLKISFLGGVGEFGKNITVYDQDGRLLVVDAGAMFPEGDIPGIDLIIPSFSYLEDNADRLEGLVLTHGHEDHIGAAPFLLERIPVPVWGTRLTLGLLGRKLGELNLRPPGIHEIVPGEPFTAGPFTVSGIPVTHSIPDAVSLKIRTPDALVVHSGDFKLDQSPLDGRLTDYHRFIEAGREGVTALLMDSTNAGEPGISGTERTVVDTLERYVLKQESTIFLALFSTNLHRIQAIYDIAARHGKKVVRFGRSIVENTRVAQDLDILRIPENVSIQVEDVGAYPPDQVIALVTGSQGEPLAALNRIVSDHSKDLFVKKGDVLLMSARIIPGNEKRVGRILNDMCRKGGRVVTYREDSIHVSGHAHREEIKLMASWVRPQYYVPVHGEVRMLMNNADLARQVGIAEERIILCENGDSLCFEYGGLVAKEQVPVGSLLIDVDSRDPVDRVVVRDRRNLSSGVVVPIVVMDRHRDRMASEPEIVSRGYPYLEQNGRAQDEIRRDLKSMVAALPADDRSDPEVLRAKVKSRVKKTLKNNDQGIPLIVPVVMETR